MLYSFTLINAIYYLPKKIHQELQRSIKPQKVQDSEADDYGCSDSMDKIKLYGKWQLEPLNLPHAVNGIVPRVMSLTFWVLFKYWK